MGRKLDALLGRGFKTAKFKALVNLAISRLAVLKNQRQVRSSQARSDVVQLLNLGHYERALLRVELVIKEQNMLDAFVIIESYCHLLIERAFLIANDKECPDELKESISTIIFAASRCGEFPEVQEIRNIFTSRYGKEFASRAVELRNNCGVNPRIIQKFSTRQPSLENRMKLLKEIASENGITLKLQEEEVKVEVNQKQNEVHDLTEGIERSEEKYFSESMKPGKQYTDVVSAAQAAFESAAYAAAAARAAVELSREKSQDINDPSSLLEKIHPTESSPSESSDSEGDEPPAKSHREIQIKESEERKNKAELARSVSASSSGSSIEGTFVENKKTSNQKPGESAYDPSDDEIKREEEGVFDESDDEAKLEEGIILWSQDSQLGFNEKSSFAGNEFRRTQLSTATVTNKDHSDLDASRIKQSPLRSQDYLHRKLYTNKVVMGSGNEDDDPVPMESKKSLYFEDQVSAPRMKIGMKPVSVRTRRA
ncbi:uncharacterized protein LOC122063194 [Macadamia integrifolia]|uniref:uncharacterized protein LOC122063194 n=1 Tax=Macadamia integrifolia TaxID=60698 RepID=UPI001C4F1DEC|nr:uncharacterized protein LOC122063194 [Macadamia integrifolia]